MPHLISNYFWAFSLISFCFSFSPFGYPLLCALPHLGFCRVRWPVHLCGPIRACHFSIWRLSLFFFFESVSLFFLFVMFVFIIIIIFIYFRANSILLGLLLLLLCFPSKGSLKMKQKQNALRSISNFFFVKIF